MLGLCCPCFMCRWDRNALLKLEEDPYDTITINDDFIESFKELRKIKCKEEVLYKLPQIQEYIKLNETDFRVGSC